MKFFSYLLVAMTISTFTACDQKSGNKSDGIKDAFNARPNEGLRDAGEHIGDAADDARKGVNDAIND